MSKRNFNIAAYAVLALALVVGVWAMTERSSHQLVDNINETVSALCVRNIAALKKENRLRDVQIETVSDTRKLNLQEGDKKRAEINRKYIIALKNAKRHIPTIEECNQKLLK